MNEIPNDKEEQRCQAVASNGEGKAPTTASVDAPTAAPGNLAGSGMAQQCEATTFYPQRYIDALNKEIRTLRESHALTERKLFNAMHALSVLRRDSKSPDLVKVYCAIMEDTIAETK